MFTDISHVTETEFNGRTVLYRLVQAIGYRFQRCVDGFESDDGSYAPAEGATSVDGLIEHIKNLIIRTTAGLGFEPCPTDQSKGNNIDAALGEMGYLCNKIETLDDVWEVAPEKFYLINGPLADALTHIGQLNLYKRCKGISPARVGYYQGSAKE